jgi:AAA15 family ATPase/GTPase
MLLDFRVRNYRSIRDEQALNLVASNPDKSFRETHLVPTRLKSIPYVVRSAVLYGPNASGKSNLLRAMDYMRAVVGESAISMVPGALFNVQPFRLDAEYSAQPTEFEISFLMGGLRHQYGFTMTSQRILNESLVVYQSAKPTQWFRRAISEDGDSYSYEFSSALIGPKKLWQDSTRANALFLSTAAQLNSELLGPVFRWLTDSILFLPAHAMVDHNFTTAMLATVEGRAQIRDFLTTADISIEDIQTITRKGVRNQLLIQAGGITHSSMEEDEFLVPVFHHKTPNGSARFELQDESEGTQRLYSLVAPILDVLREGRILVVDELDSSLHTLLVRRLISMFHDPDINKNGAQLIFSTHDTSLLDHSLFRRDQIWFTEKDRAQATHLYPLTDFSPRKNEAWERGYLGGRYGAVPFFGDVPLANPTSSPGRDGLRNGSLLAQA